MQGTNLGPSPTPTFLPSSNPPVAVEAPPASDDIAVTDTNTLSAGGIVGIVLAVVVVCVAIAWIVYKKYRPHGTSQQASKAETDDAENPAEPLATTNSSMTDAVNEDDKVARESKLLDDAFDRALHWFPGLLNGWGRADFRTLQRLKKNLREALGDILRKDSSLCNRINGPSLFLKLGMDKEVVEKRFSALIGIEEELQIVGKSSFVDTIDLMIDYIEVKNPVGQVNDKIQDMGSYARICVRMEKGKLLQAIELVESQLKGKGWHNLFEHGTKASVAMETFSNRKSFEMSNGKHDFGPGLYCFRNDLLASLSFAADRSFPSKENPCIFAFPEPRDDIDDKTVDINGTAIEQALLQKLLVDEDQYNELEEAQRTWNSEEKNWNTALALARWYQKDLTRFYGDNEIQVLKGWLHDVNKTDGTDQGEHPVLDSDKWIQYCVKDQAWLGKKIVFIEFDMQWEQWDRRRGDTPDDTLDRIDNDITEVWRKHMEGRVQHP